MRKVIAVLLLLALLATVLLAYRSGKFSLANFASSSVNISAQLVNQVNANSCYCITGKPTISASFINQVLAYYHSPASRLGGSLYSLGVRYGINPVYALAFFMHESRLGLAGVARYSLSLGNIRCSAGYRCIDGYRAYSSWSNGFQDWYKLLRNLYVDTWHLITVEQIIPTYAPPGDHNNVRAYIAALETAVRTWDSGEVEVAG